MPPTTVGRFQMLWDCPACGTQGLLGLDHRHCPACGAAQDPTRRYYPTDAQKVAVEDHPFHGADLQCPACDTPNGAKAAHCVNCGAPLAGGKVVAARSETLADVADDAAVAKAEADARKKAAAEAASHAAAVASGAAPKSGTRQGCTVLGLVLSGIVLVVLLIGGVFLINQFWTRPAEVTVTGHRWERTIVLEALRAVQEQAWRDGLPAGATAVICQREQRDTRNVPDGETCTTKRVDQGDGTFNEVRDCQPKYRSEAVYDERCRYMVDRWVTIDTLRAAGNSVTPAPTWPVHPVATSTLRTGARTETYTVQLRDPDGVVSECTYDASRWAAMSDGATFQAEKGGLTGNLQCDSLHAG